jgi:hypothetical protein
MVRHYAHMSAKLSRPYAGQLIFEGIKVPNQVSEKLVTAGHQNDRAPGHPQPFVVERSVRRGTTSG